ncbi:MAG: carbon-nitrogen hydrolase family protein [Pseudomonadales bacterium]
MTSPSLVRVAVAQYAVGADIDANLARALSMLDEVASCKPGLVVLPEFANHLSWYDDKAHCYQVSVEQDGPFLSAIAAKAAEISAYVVVNVTLRRGAEACTGSSLLYSPEGNLLAVNDKQVYIGHENDFLEKATEHGPITETAVGRLGLYACMDGVICETPRYLGLRGAQILCNSLNSFAPDEANLHIPVRASENRVFVAAANKVGPLVPEELLDVLSGATNIPVEFLMGAGESQIVAPDGTVLAMADKTAEGFVFADIDPALADDKTRPDGTDVFASRRPELYGPIAADPATQSEFAATDCESVQAAMVQLPFLGEAAILEAADAVAQAVGAGARLVVLPELFCYTDDESKNDDAALARADIALMALATVCGDEAYVVTSLPQRDGQVIRHSAVLINQQGVVGSQHQLHSCNRFAWAVEGDEVNIIETPIGRIGMATGDDVIYPEMFRLLTIAGAEIIAVPFAAQEAWECRTGLIERAAENHVCMVAVTQPSELGCSFGGTVHKDFTVLTPWETRVFDGNLTYPVTTRMPAESGIGMVELNPAWTTNKVVSSGTDVVRGRAWHLADAILANV